MLRRIPAALVMTVLATSLALAADVAGKWRADFETQDGQKAHNVFTFQVDGEKVSGSVFSSFSGTEAKIEEGQIKGDQISFAITRNFGGSDVRLRYAGKVGADDIKFVVTAVDGGDGFKIEMTARREKP